ncbi:hypothetical protein MDA_GLEAN10023539 [Myotis davidii]|uniref:Uncharacterized protein n=1 Tax=Myotis davidii TaxID=225400 RepID=L5M096_MYODS|nr:hypothetical protein MDA_GLEAN10023539 [Myotis davidii]
MVAESSGAFGSLAILCRSLPPGPPTSPLPTDVSPHDLQGQTDWSWDGQPGHPTCPSLPSGLSVKLSDQILDFNDEDLEIDREGQNPEAEGEVGCKRKKGWTQGIWIREQRERHNQPGLPTAHTAREIRAGNMSKRKRGEQGTGGLTCPASCLAPGSVTTTHPPAWIVASEAGLSVDEAGKGKGQDQIACTARLTPVLRHRTARSGTFLWILPDALTSSKSAKVLLEAYRQRYELLLIKRSPHNDNTQ